LGDAPFFVNKHLLYICHKLNITQRNIIRKFAGISSSGLSNAETTKREGKSETQSHRVITREANVE
jgi:hypothetical protein